MSTPGDEIVRYEAGTRVTHWTVALSFVLLALSGLAMFYPALFWLSDLFGGGALNRAIHPWLGLVMAIAFVALVGQIGLHMGLTGNDRQWLRQAGDVVGNREENLPEVGR